MPLASRAVRRGDRQGATAQGPADATGDRDPVAVPDAARAVLSRVRAAARQAPVVEQARGARPSRPARRRTAGFSGPGPDDRDPMTLGSAWTGLVEAQGWRSPLDVARLHGLWAQIVGPVNAEHVTPESFDVATGELLLRTSSTAWAEQLRLMMPALRASIDDQVGSGVVKDIRISGPTPPRGPRGRLRVRGRGPRDTYG